MAKTHSTVPIVARILLLPNKAIIPKTTPTPATTTVALFKKSTGEPTTPMMPEMSAVQASPLNFDGFDEADGGGVDWSGGGTGVVVMGRS
ncbi:hypothetical protein GCM10009754_84740 [Amycolatopsis minnesotensis]|uniref:Uncharacterized protein n=1 Tax=Amycolatopsis minnesotensis TaxID=337894 RepID=A0ABN2SUE5_9PSEU